MVKYVQKVLVVLCAVVLCFANSFSASALDFDFDVISESVFIVASGDVNGYEMSLGSGFAIDDNHIVTNAHVITDRKNIAIGCYSESAENNIGDIHTVELVSINENIDIAVLKIRTKTLTPLRVADVDKVKVGDDVYAIGAPEGLAYTLTKGTVSSKNREINDVYYIQTDTAINQGNSGGPLLNSDGEVIGVNTLKLSASENIGFAIRMDFVMSYIEKNNIIGGGNSSLTSDQDSNGNYDYDTDFWDDENDDYDYDYDYNYDFDFDSTIIFIVLSVMGLVSGVVFLVLKLTVWKNSEESDLEIRTISNNAVVEKGAYIQNIQETTLIQKRDIGLQVLTGNMVGRQFELEEAKTYTIGKDVSLANILFDVSYTTVSRVHCTVTYDAKFDKYFVIDCSSNGTYYENGTRLTKNTRTPIARGTVLMLADDMCKILFK